MDKFNSFLLVFNLITKLCEEFLLFIKRETQRKHIHKRQTTRDSSKLVLREGLGYKVHWLRK